jgi:hypothetical protein
MRLGVAILTARLGKPTHGAARRRRKQLRISLHCYVSSAVGEATASVDT